jgi:hypothetical protein
MSEKLGRNPFQGNGRSTAAPKKRSVKAKHTSPREFFKSLWKSKLERFSFVRYDRIDNKGRVTLFAVGMRNPAISSNQSISIGLMDRPIRVDLVSLKIQNA